MLLKPTSTFTGEVYLDLILMESTAALARNTFTPCTTHRHGADDGSNMIHFVVSIGEAKWNEQVTDEEYKKRGEN
ncbi:RmlC-like cupin [Penicillium riverlandense]|uniref:RmlC-like cupin n=1 Tax=Penicillium riverlandense TaxID=1903569 RepID=UPI002547EACC|nr:RmlC-like cupin [Penicillium riverlandense]KAJ5807973.1 RmlC-like cupin [Penicillium riverlandense]